MTLSILIAAAVADGHTGPMLAVARQFASAGHRVRFLGGYRFADAIRATGAEFLPWPEDAQVDFAVLAAEAAARGDRNESLAAFGRTVDSCFVAPAAGQYRGIIEALAAEPTDAVLSELAVTGASAVVFSPTPRPPVIIFGVVPLLISSRDLPPAGLGLLPMPGWRGRLRDRVLMLLAEHVVLRRPLHRIRDAIHELTGVRPEVPWVDFPKLADRFLQLTVPGFEFSRSDLPANLRFVGPLLSPPDPAVDLPEWWDDLAGRTVVHVSQGTIANSDPTELILPTLEALADRDLVVVVTTGGPPVDTLGPLPANVRAAEFIPYELLMPQVDIFVTNAGYGGIHHALAGAVPMVAAGDTEDKRTNSALIAWTGTGVNLKTARPTPAELAAAVDTVLQEPSYRACAADLAAQIAAAPGLAGLEGIVMDLIGTAQKERHG